MELDLRLTDLSKFASQRRHKQAEPLALTAWTGYVTVRRFKNPPLNEKIVTNASDGTRT
jgi:hypothetical protein